MVIPTCHRTRRTRRAGRAGIDASESVIEAVRQRAARNGLDVEFHVATAQDLPMPPDRFGIVAAAMVLLRRGFTERRSFLPAFLAAAVTPPLGTLVSCPFISRIHQPLLGVLLAPVVILIDVTAERPARSSRLCNPPTGEFR